MNPELKPWFKNQISIRSQDLTVNTVFGIHGTEDLPARFLSGFIPGFGLAEFLQESGANNPTLRIFIPQQIAETVNHLDPVSSQINRQFGQALLQHFVDNFHPDIFVSFDPDEPLTDTAFDILLQLADLLKNNLHPTIDSMIQRRSQHTSSPQETLIYAAHHPFGWQDMFHLDFFRQTPSLTTINCLPPSDKPFAAVRKHILNLAADDPSLSRLIHPGTNVDIITTGSRTPHYILIDNEPTISQIANEPQGEGWALQDLSERIKTESDPQQRNRLKEARKDLQKVINHLNAKRKQKPSLPNLQDMAQQAVFDKEI